MWMGPPSCLCLCPCTRLGGFCRRCCLALDPCKSAEWQGSHYCVSISLCVPCPRRVKAQVLQRRWCCTRDLAGWAPGCSLLTVLSRVCCWRVPLREEGSSLEPWRASRRADGVSAWVGKRGGGQAASACLGQQRGGGARARLGRLSLKSLSLSLWLRRPVCCLLRSLSLYSLVFWVGLEWFLPGYFIFSGSASPAFHPVCSASQLRKPQIRDHAAFLQSLRPQSLSKL